MASKCAELPTRHYPPAAACLSLAVPLLPCSTAPPPLRCSSTRPRCTGAGRAARSRAARGRSRRTTSQPCACCQTRPSEPRQASQRTTSAVAGWPCGCWHCPTGPCRPQPRMVLPVLNVRTTLLGPGQLPMMPIFTVHPQGHRRAGSGVQARDGAGGAHLARQRAAGARARPVVGGRRGCVCVRACVRARVRAGKGQAYTGCVGCVD